MKKAIVIILILINLLSLRAQDFATQKFGIFFGGNYNMHTANFQRLPGLPNCCPRFEDGNGLGFNGGILYENKIFGDNLWIGARLGILSLNGILLKEEPTTIIVNGIPTAGAFEHKVDATFMNIDLEPYLQYNPISSFGVFAGMRFGTFISKKYSQVETIVKPAGVGTFLDSNGNDTYRRTRNEFTSDSNVVPFQMGIFMGISYELPMNNRNTLRLVPEISYYLALSDLVENTDWKANALKVGIALKYAPEPYRVKQDIFERRYKIDTLKIELDRIAENRVEKGKEKIETNKIETYDEFVTTEIITRTDTFFVKKTYFLNGEITSVGVDYEGNEIPNPVFKIEEYVSNRLDPLLNYIFFEDNSSKIPSRYHLLSESDVPNFDVISLLRDSTIAIYQNLLNVVGKRMLENKSAKITLLGCNSDIGAERNNSELSSKRAEEVKNYLVNVWKIGNNRIKTESRGLPAKASLPKDEADKIAENRRVEILSDEYEILKPVFIEKIDRTANPPIARFKQSANSEIGLQNWEVTAYQTSDPANKYISSGTSQLPQTVDWKLDNFQKIIPKSPEPLMYSLKLTDTKGNEKLIDSKTIPIKVVTLQEKKKELLGDYEIERFSLILFDFDKANIEGNNQKIIDFIKTRIKPNSEVEISGYTDRTGDEEYNKKLSSQRAEQTKKALNVPTAKSQGFGEDKLIYDNELPEGRFYCRTIEILVKTKKE